MSTSSLHYMPIHSAYCLIKNFLQLINHTIYPSKSLAAQRERCKQAFPVCARMPPITGMKRSLMSLKNIMSKRKGLILLAFIAFIALGLPDGLLGVGWPSMRNDFSISLDSMDLLLFTATIGYLTSSFLNGKLISLFGIGGVLAASCALTVLR